MEECREELIKTIKEALKDKSVEELINIIVELELKDAELKSNIETELRKINHMMILDTLKRKY